MNLWCDVSSNYAIVPSPQDVADLVALGFKGAFVGSSWSNVKAQQQLAAFEAGGLPTEEYQFPEAPQPTTRGRWLDCETNTATLDAVRARLADGTWRGPYSRKGWADENLPGWDCKAEFPDSELWDARYVHGDGFPCLIKKAVENGGDIRAAINIEFSWLNAFAPYWGFTEAAITQWHNSITIANVNMDLNDVREDEMADGPTKEEFQALAGLVVKQGQEITELKGYAWRDALRINDLEDHTHDAGGVQTGLPE